MCQMSSIFSYMIDVHLGIYCVKTLRTYEQGISWSRNNLGSAGVQVKKIIIRVHQNQNHKKYQFHQNLQFQQNLQFHQNHYIYQNRQIHQNHQIHHNHRIGQNQHIHQNHQNPQNHYFARIIKTQLSPKLPKPEWNQSYTGCIQGSRPLKNLFNEKDFLKDGFPKTV